MLPLSWLKLFSFFSILLTLFNVMNYYTPFNKTTSLTPIKAVTKTLNWKW